MNPPDSPIPSTAEAPPRRAGTLWIPLLAFAAYALLLAWYTGACAGGSDSSGYLNNARLLGSGRIVTPTRQIEGLDPASLPSYAYVPLGFIPHADRAHMIPTYPMGLPLLVFAASRVASWALAPGLVMALHSLLGLWLVYRLGRACGLAPGWAWLAALIMAASPLYLLMSLQLMSDIPAMLWMIAAVLAAWRSRERPWMAVAAGVALSLAVLLRPVNLLGIVPVAIVLGISWRRWLLLAAGGLPGAIFLGFVNHAAYGRILITGYGNPGWLFSWANVPGTLVHYGFWLPLLFTPLIVLAPAVLLLARRQRLPVVLLTSWVFVYFGFHLFYFHTHEDWWYLRFLLPSLPALLVAALLAAQSLAARASWRPRAWQFGAAATLLLVYGAFCFRHFHIASSGRNELLYPQVATWMKEHLPKNAAVACMQTSGALFCYTDHPLVRWDMLSPADADRIAAACAAAGRPFYAVLFPFEIEEWGAFTRHLGGHWVQVGSVRYVSIWRLEPRRPAR